jgi:hypothetical protein
MAILADIIMLYVLTVWTSISMLLSRLGLQSLP